MTYLVLNKVPAFVESRCLPKTRLGSIDADQPITGADRDGQRSLIAVSLYQCVAIARRNRPREGR
jgi:hypothetical protein